MDKQQKEKPKWTKPELTALVRNKPEEAVLTACKFATGATVSGVATGCFTNVCSPCSGATPS